MWNNTELTAPDLDNVSLDKDWNSVKKKTKKIITGLF